MQDRDYTHQEQNGRYVRTVVLLPPSTVEALEKIKERTGAPISATVRLSVTQYLSGREERHA